MLCYRCGSHTKDGSEKCENCGQLLSTLKKPGQNPNARTESSSYEFGPYKIGDTIAARYLVKNIIGMGPSGHVYRVHDNHPGIQPQDAEIALKVVHNRYLKTPVDRDRFHRALSFVSKINHPGLCRVIIEGEDQGHTYFTMPLVRGLSLARAIDMRKGQKPFSLLDAEPIIGQLCQILETMHQFGAHGGINPDNILIQPPGDVRVTDSMMMRGLPLKPYLAGFGQKSVYIAPELRTGDSQQLTPQADVYSIGVILYEMLTGEKPSTLKIAETDRALLALPKEVAELLAHSTDTALDKRILHPAVIHSRLVHIISHNQAYQELVQNDGVDRTIVSQINPFFAQELQGKADKDGDPLTSVQGNLRKQNGLIGVLIGLFLFIVITVSGTLIYLNQSSFLSLKKGLDLAQIWQNQGPPAKSIPSTESKASSLPTSQQSDSHEAEAPHANQADMAANKAAAPPTLPARNASGCFNGMNFIKGGRVIVGSSEQDEMRQSSDRPSTSLDVKPFCIDKYEFPNHENTMPLAQITPLQAKNLCIKQGKRLCTEEEWERACKGPNMLRFPYGEAYQENLCAVEPLTAQISGKYKQCVSGFGVYDLAGNLAEITESKSDTEFLLKGGSFKSLDYATRCAYRNSTSTNNKSATVGFRCCADSE